MKYKNRLVIPTLVSTSLLASAMAVNAEEVDQENQYSGENTEEYAENDERSEINLDFIESDEGSGEEAEDADKNSEEKDSEESDEETDELETKEEAEEVVENTLDEKNIETEAAETTEGPVEETFPAEENSVEDVTAELSEAPVEAAESAEQSAETEQNTETTPAEENTEDAAPAEEQSDEVDENVLDEADTEPAEQPIASELNSEDNNEEVSAVESNEEDAELAESDEQKNEIPESAEKDTYKYDSESLKQELQNLSEEEQTVFLEENADNIEADEEMLNSLSEGLAASNEEINADEIAVATASTLSTTSLSETITDINDYISENNFEVAEIQYDYIPGLPEYAYHSNYGWDPENGEVGKPKGVVLHDVGNDNSTIYGEIEYMSRNYENAFVHAFVDANNIIQVADTDYLAYGAGPYSNDLHMHVELVRHDNAHDFAKSINNYADYIANLLYKYKLPAVSAEETGEGTLWSHVAVSNHLGGTASPDPYDYFARFNYEYNDVINLIGERYADMFNKRTTPQISMPIEQGTADLVAEVNADNLGLYESVTDVRTKNANELLGQQFRVVRTATYNYDDYYLLENEDGVALGWMNAGDLTTSEYVPEVEQEEDLKDETPAEPEVPAEPELEEPGETADEAQAPEEEPADAVEEDNTSDDQIQDDENQGEPVNPETPAQPEDDAFEGSEKTDDSTEENTDEGSVENSEGTSSDSDAETPEATDDSEDDSDNQTEENSSVETNDSNQETVEQESEVSDENTEETDQDSEVNEETTEADTVTDVEVSSTLEDSATGVRVVSATNELEGKSIVVTVMNPSNAINASHDLYDIHILDENGSLYRLNNPVTVYLPANGYVSNVYYLGDIGETLEAVNYRTEDGYAVFDVNSFSQYAVVYGNDNKDNTTVPVVAADSGTGGEEPTDQTNEHPTVYTETDMTAEDEAAAAVSNDANHDGSGGTKETEQEMLPDTGTAEQSTTIFAAILAALGLGFLVKRRKTIEK